MRLLTVMAIALAILGPEPAVASDEEHEAEHSKNVIAGFIGLTHERRENGLALGVEYERRLTDTVGIAVSAERTWGDFDFWVVAVPVYFGGEHWRFGLGPGVEVVEGSTEPLARFVVSYSMEGENLHYAPALAIDFVDGEQVYVLGVAVGFGF